MNTITEPRHSNTGSKVPESGFEGGKGPQPKPGLGELWLAILALVAVVGLAVAVASGAFDSSSEAVTVVDPRADADSHREPPALNKGMDSDVHRELNQQASSTDASSGYVNGGLDPETQLEIYEQASQADTVDPRLDADHHREPSNG